MAIPEAVHTDLTAKDDLFIAAALDIDDTVHPGAGNDTVSGGWGDDVIDDGISHIHWAYGAWAIAGPLVLIAAGYRRRRRLRAAVPATTRCGASPAATNCTEEATTTS